MAASKKTTPVAPVVQDRKASDRWFATPAELAGKPVGFDLVAVIDRNHEIRLHKPSCAAAQRPGAVKFARYPEAGVMIMQSLCCKPACLPRPAKVEQPKATTTTPEPKARTRKASPAPEATTTTKTTRSRKATAA
jgi:hypothetical protein